MRKTVLCLLLALAFTYSCALAQKEDAFATYMLPDGAEAVFFAEAASLDVPDGLEPMYALMLTASFKSDVYVVRMKHGRALASVSCTPLDAPVDAQAMLARWPEIAQTISKTVLYINADESCAAVAQRYGREAFTVTTDIAVGDESMLLLRAEGLAFAQGSDLIELWAVRPADPVYLYDAQAAAELASDREDLQFFLDSLAFPEA